MTKRMKTRLIVGVALLAGIGAFVGANAHLLWTSMRSQPGCVPHLEAPAQDGRFRAAQSSC